MGHQIRKLMDQDHELLLEGIVEVDEVYLGGRKRRQGYYHKKTPVFRLVERGGTIKAYVTNVVSKTTARDMLFRHVYLGSKLMTDDSRIYVHAREHYTHDFTVHSKKEYVRGNTHTNTIEGFWGQLQRSLRGTHHSISRKWTQSYINEYVFRYNHRAPDIFWLIVDRVYLHGSQ